MSMSSHQNRNVFRDEIDSIESAVNDSDIRAIHPDKMEERRNIWENFDRARKYNPNSVTEGCKTPSFFVYYLKIQIHR